jgi:hypothetical protein
MRRFVLFITLVVLTACGRAEPTPAPTSAPIAVPTATLAPEPTPIPDTAFLDWLTASEYEFRTDTEEGGKRYARPSDPNAVTVDIYPDGVAAWGLTVDSNAATAVLSETTSIVIQAIELQGVDAEPVRTALQAPYELPLTIQNEAYTFLLERTAIGFNTRVTFLAP